MAWRLNWEMRKVLFVGGHPKGYRDAFSKRTLSGKRLRKIIEPFNFKWQTIDVWRNQDEENREIENENILQRLIKAYEDGWVIVVLGRKVGSFLETTRLAFDCKLHDEKFWYLPHPASRNRKSLELLRVGLFAISKGFKK